MAENQIVVYSIGDQEEYHPIRKFGFFKAKYCGKGAIGFKIALGLGYLEELSLRQHSNYPNTIFLESYLEHFIKDNSELSEVLQSIYSKSSNQSKIVQMSKSSSSFVSQVNRFIEQITSIPEDSTSIFTIINDEAFQKSLEPLNIQLVFYTTSQGMVGSLKPNKHIYPVVLNFLISEIDESVYNLYHEHYTDISPENLNTSEEFNDSQVDPLDQLEKLAQVLLERLPSLSTLSKLDQDALKTLIKQIKSSNLAGFTYESLLSS